MKYIAEMFNKTRIGKSILFSAVIAVMIIGFESCAPGDEDDVTSGILAYLLSGAGTDICSMTMSGDAQYTCASGVLSVTSGSLYVYGNNSYHPLTSAEMKYQLGSGGSIRLLGGMGNPDGSIADGHGFDLTETTGKFVGQDSSGGEVISSSVYTPGTTANTICMEIHGDENPAHILAVWSYDSCDSVSSSADADNDSETVSLNNNENISVKRYRGLVVSGNVTISSLRWFAEEHFAHGG